MHKGYLQNKIKIAQINLKCIIMKANFLKILTSCMVDNNTNWIQEKVLHYTTKRTTYKNKFSSELAPKCTFGKN